MSTSRIISMLLLMLLTPFGVFAQRNTISTPDVTLGAGSTIPLQVNLDNSADIVALQFSIAMPEGIMLEESSAQVTGRCNGHSIAFKNVDNNKYTMLLMSPDNSPIGGRTGAVATIDLYAFENVEDGAVFQPVISDVAIVGADGSNLATGFSAGKVTIAKNPDLKVGEVSASVSRIRPGDNLAVSWNVENIGGLPTTSGWSEQIFLEDERGNSAFVMTTFYENSLSAGGVVSRNAEILIPEVVGIDGDVKVKVTVKPNADAGEPYWLLENNTAESGSFVFVEKRVYLNPGEVLLAEESSQYAEFSLTRSGLASEPETFRITLPADTRFTFPQSVTIPAGDSGVYFYVSVKPDNALNEKSDFTLTLEGDGYEPVSASIKVEDDTFPTLALTPSSQEVTEGEPLTFTVAILRECEDDIEVSLACDLPSRFRIPAGIRIPAGEKSAMVTVESIDDNTPDIERGVTFTASAPGQQPASVNIILEDNDIPALELQLHPSTVAESDGPLAVSAIVKRTDNIDKLVTISLEDDSDGAIYYSQRKFEMKPGVEEAIVNLGPIDNSIVDGERHYNISASVFIASCSCNATNGESGGTVSAKLTVTDDDGPALSVSAPSSMLMEGGELTATVERNTDLSSSLTVGVSSDHADMLELPSTVVIPAGEKSASFTIKSKENSSTGDGFNATLLCEAEGYAKGSFWFTVTDQTLPDAQLSSFAANAGEVIAGDKVEVKVTLQNTGAIELPELAKVDFMLNTSSEPVASYYLQKPLAAGSEIEVSREIDMPETVGTFNLYAVVNAERSVKELSYGNNASNIVKVATVAPFTASVTTDKSAYLPGETVKVKGKLSHNDDVRENVEIYFINEGYRQTLMAESDGEGNFSAEFTPMPGQMGEFIAGACYPGENSREKSASFNIYGLTRQTWEPITCETEPDEQFSSKFVIYNPASVALTGLTVKADNVPANCSLNVACAERIDGGGKAEVEFTITPLAPTSGKDWERINLTVNSAEGAVLPVAIYHYCRSARAQMDASVSAVKTTMVKGASRDYVFEIANNGRGETGKITLSLPAWMSTSTPKEMASLAMGETAKVILRLTPADDMALNVPVTGNIGINCENGSGISLPYSIEPVSETTGTLTIDVCDENTYYTSEAPHVGGATVTLYHPVTGAVVAQGETGGDGRFSFVVPEGYYAVSVTAPSHESYQNNYLVDPGVETVKTVNLSLDAVKVDWRVEETEVEDEYEIVSTVNYETNVPVPIVEISMPSFVPAKDLMPGESLVFNVTLTNRGLITAKDVQLLLPEGLKALVYDQLDNNEPFHLTPGQSVQIPVRITHRENAGEEPAKVKPIDDDPCVNQVGTLYYWDCGPDHKWHRYGIGLQVGSCYSPDPSTWDNSGNGTYGGYGYGWWGGYGGWGGIGGPVIDWNDDHKNGSEDDRPKPSEKKDYDCEPCQNQFMMALASCIPNVGMVIAAGQAVGDGIKCARAADSNLSNRDKLKNCPFTEGVPDAVDAIKDMCDRMKDLAENVKNDNLSDDDWDLLKDGLEAGAEKVLDNYLDSDHSGLTKEQRDFLKDTKDFSDALDKSRDAFKNGEIDGQKLYETVPDVTEGLEKLIKKKNPALAGKIGNVGRMMKKAPCIGMMLAPCDLEAPDTVPGDSVVRKVRSVSSVVELFKANMKKCVQLVECEEDYFAELFGDEQWLEVKYGKRMPLLIAMFDEEKPIDASDFIRVFKPGEVSNAQFERFIERWNNSFFYEDVESDNKIDFNYIENLFENGEKAADELVGNGDKDIEDVLTESFEAVQKEMAKGGSSVCASISLQFSQKMVMTRQAFRGTLTVFNGNEEKPMENVRLALTVKDPDGNVATSHEFQINAESMDGFEGELSLDGGWTLGAQESGTASILFIPTKYAAPTEERVYAFGGSLSYVDPFSGLEVTRILSPVSLTVNPSPQLNLTYFMQRDVIGDDPHTEIVEPSEDAEFALLINNVGYGDASNIRMLTKQPEVVSNDKGLAFDVEIVSSRLNGGEKNLALGGSVATEFGDIKAGKSAYSQWFFRGSLLGHFTDYEIEANHVSSYGNPDLSLLNEVSIHELIRSLDVAEEDGMSVGFMTNDIEDVNDTPDRIYFTDGSTSEVKVADSAEIRYNLDGTYSIFATSAESGWMYGNVPDPTYGVSHIVSVTRKSDGAEIPVRNFWQTDRTLRDGTDPAYENRIHFADCVANVGAEEYVLRFTPAPGLMLEVVSIEGAPAWGEVLAEPLGFVDVMFNKHIDPSTFTASDIRMFCQGESLDAGLIGISTDDNKRFRLDLSAISADSVPGYYSITVSSADVVDDEGFSGRDAKNAGWNYYPAGSILLGVKVYPELSGTVVAVRGSETVNIDSARVINADYNEQISFSAKAEYGYEFSQWTSFGKAYSSDEDMSVTALANDDIVAVFVPRNFDVEIDSFCDGGEIIGAGTGLYPYGDELTLMAVADKSHIFGNWVVNGEKKGTESTFTLSVDGDMKISAVFLNLSGVFVPEADRKIVIYSADGLLISSDADVETIRSLSKGVYIINGVKHIVR